MKLMRFGAVLGLCGFALLQVALATGDDEDSKRVQKLKRPSGQQQPSQNEIEKAWENWVERYAAQWEHWAQENEGRWESFGEAHAKRWEEWGENYGQAWEEWAEQAEQLEEGGKFDIDEIVALSLNGLEEMPLDELQDMVAGQLTSMEGIDWSGLEELQGLIQMTVEESLKGVDLSELESELRTTLEQALGEVQEASENVRSAVESKRGRRSLSSNRNWERLEALLKGVAEEDREEAAEDREVSERDRERIRRRSEELRRGPDSQRSEETVRQLRKERDELQQRDREVEARRAEIEARRAEIEALKQKEGGQRSRRRLL